MRKITYTLLFAILTGFSLNVNGQSSVKVRFIDLQYIAQQLPSFKKAQAELKVFNKQLESEMMNKQTELKKKMETYQKEEATLSDLIRASRQQEINRLRDELVKFDRTAQQQSLAKEQQLLAPIYKSISKNVETYSNDKQIDFVLQKDKLVYDTQAFNISNDILKKMGVTPKAVTPKGGKK